MSGHPDMIIVCEHDIPGGQLDEVVRYIWPEHRDPYGPYWGVPVVGPSGEVNETRLAGDRPGIGRLADVVAFGPARFHHEIICTQRGCTRLGYRSDVKRLQTLFDAIVDDDILRYLCVSASDTEIVIKLYALHLARETAKQRYGLRV